MKKKLKVICIIPARGGSKGIKLKNLQKVNNKPLIYYPIKAAIKSKVCDKICVSTDSDIIANISEYNEIDCKVIWEIINYLRKNN